MESTRYAVKFQCDGMWSYFRALRMRPTVFQCNIRRVNGTNMESCAAIPPIKYPSILTLALHHTTRCSPLKPDVSAYAK